MNTNPNNQTSVTKYYLQIKSLYQDFSIEEFPEKDLYTPNPDSTTVIDTLQNQNVLEAILQATSSNKEEKFKPLSFHIQFGFDKPASKTNPLGHGFGVMHLSKRIDRTEKIKKFFDNELKKVKGNKDIACLALLLRYAANTLNSYYENPSDILILLDTYTGNLALAIKIAKDQFFLLIFQKKENELSLITLFEIAEEKFNSYNKSARFLNIVPKKIAKDINANYSANSPTFFKKSEEEKEAIPDSTENPVITSQASKKDFSLSSNQLPQDFIFFAISIYMRLIAIPEIGFYEINEISTNELIDSGFFPNAENMSNILKYDHNLSFSHNKTKFLYEITSSLLSEYEFLFKESEKTIINMEKLNKRANEINNKSELNPTEMKLFYLTKNLFISYENALASQYKSLTKLSHQLCFLYSVSYTLIQVKSGSHINTKYKNSQIDLPNTTDPIHVGYQFIDSLSEDLKQWEKNNIPPEEINDRKKIAESSKKFTDITKNIVDKNEKNTIENQNTIEQKFMNLFNSFANITNNVNSKLITLAIKILNQVKEEKVTLEEKDPAYPTLIKNASTILNNPEASKLPSKAAFIKALKEYNNIALALQAEKNSKDEETANIADNSPKPN